MRSFEEVGVMPESQTEEENYQVVVSNLTKLGKETGNPLLFLDIGDKLPIKYQDIRPEIIENLTADDLILVKQLQTFCHEYLCAPLFIDSFHQDNVSRRQWEKNLDQHPIELNYYKTNRLGTNFNDSVFGLLRVLVKTTENQGLSENLSELLPLIPDAFQKRAEDGSLLYDSLGDDKKIEVSHQVADLARKILEKIESNKA